MPKTDERVLVSHSGEGCLDEAAIYERMLGMRKRASALDAYPHRYWDSFAVAMHKIL
jgi:hypothetical protein